MWLDKEMVGNTPPKTGNIDPRSPALGESTVNILLIGGSKLLQESVIQLLDDSRFSVAECVENLNLGMACLRKNPGKYQMLVFQLIDHNDARFFERLAEIKRTDADLQMVLLAWPIKELTFLTHSYELGVDAYLESTTSQVGFRQSLNLVASGERVFPSRLKEAAATGRRNMDARKSANSTALSTRELEILRHLSSGRANKVIANDLHITEATVKVHVKGILRKIGATNRTQAAIWAIQNGLKPIYNTGQNSMN